MSETTAVGRYRKRPVTVEALRYDKAHPEPLLHWLRNHSITYWWAGGNLLIPTLEGRMLVTDGAWVVRGVAGEFYPVAANIFEQTYEVVEGAL